MERRCVDRHSVPLLEYEHTLDESASRPGMPSSREPIAFEKALQSGRFAVTAEIVPPVSCEAAGSRSPRSDPEGDCGCGQRDGRRRGASPYGCLAAAALLLQNGIEPSSNSPAATAIGSRCKAACLGPPRLASRTSCCCAGTIRVRAISPTRSRCSTRIHGSVTQSRATSATSSELMSGQKVTGKARLSDRRSRRANRPACRLEARAPEGEGRRGRPVRSDAVLFRSRRRPALYAMPRRPRAGGFPLLIGLAPLRSARSARWIREKLFGSIVPDTVVRRLEQSSDPIKEGRRIFSSWWRS